MYFKLKLLIIHNEKINHETLSNIRSAFSTIHVCMYVSRRRPISPYCDYFDLNKQSCSLERLSINVCDLKKHSKKLPEKYQVSCTKIGHG